MSIKFNCPSCKKPLNVKDHLAGKRAPCPACKQVLTIPVPVAPPADLEDFAASHLADQPEPEAPVETRTIEFTCYYCDVKVTVSAELAGKQTPCPECRRIIKVPQLQKTAPKDWRTVDHRVPAGARRDGPAPEGAWGNTSAMAVSRQSLEEAEAIPQVRKRLTWQQWTKRGLAVAGTLAVIALAAGFVFHFIAQNRQEKIFARTLAAVEAKDAKVGPLVTAEVFRGAGEYQLRAGKPDLARTQFQKARAAIHAAESLPPSEHDFLLADLAQSQVELGGDKIEYEKGSKLKWDDAWKEVRQTVQNLKSSPVRGYAIRQVSRRLIAHGEPKRAAPLATLFSEDASDLLAQVGFELWHAQQTKDLDAVTTQALQPYEGKAPPAGGAKKPLPSPALIALCVAQGKPERAAVVAPVPNFEKTVETEALVGYAWGLALAGKADDARALIRKAPLPQDRFPAWVTLAAAAVDHGQPAEAGSSIDEAIRLLEGELGGKPGLPWALFELARAGSAAGLADRVRPATKGIEDGAIRGRAQLEILKAQLAATPNKADESLLQTVDKETPAAGLARLLIAQHDAERVGAAAQKWVDAWEPEGNRLLGNLGLALGLQAGQR